MKGIQKPREEDCCSIFLFPGFWLGCLEHADWFTDGALPVQAYLCGPSVTEHFAEAFEAPENGSETRRLKGFSVIFSDFQ